MSINCFSENLVNIYNIVDNKVKKTNEKDKKLKLINDCLDWINVLRELIIKLKKGIEGRE